MKLAIITTDYMRDFILHSMSDAMIDMQYQIYPFRELNELDDIYRTLPSDIDGILTSGSYSARFILHKFPDSELFLREFNTDDEGMYKLYLKLLKGNNELDPKRVYADVLDLVGLETDQYFFESQLLPLSDMIENSLVNMTLEELVSAEEMFTKKHLELWDKGSIDVSITRFNNTAHKLMDAGLNAYFAYPSQKHIRSVCQSALQNIRIKNLKANQIGVILITEDPKQQVDHNPTLLNQAIIKFNKKFHTDFVVRNTVNGVELFTDKKTIEYITDGLITCKLHLFFQTVLNRKLSIGYGIGKTIYQARMNAADANREADVKFAGNSCMIDEKGSLHVPLNEANRLIVPRSRSEMVMNISEKTGLSKLTIQKILSVVKTKSDRRITSRELAYRLSITIRSANRFLNILSSSGVAEMVDINKTTTKGRPEYIYQIIVNQVK